MQVIVAYKILEAASKESLEKLVNEFISKGWQPMGAVAIAGTTFYQTMVGM